MVSVFLVDPSSIGTGRGDVRAVVVDLSAGDIVVPLDEGSIEAGSSTMIMCSTSAVVELPVCSDSSARVRSECVVV
jgi:hypothetical protein